MNITLLMTTRNRLAPVRRLFESLRVQTCQTFTLLLGDQNPQGYLNALLAEYQNVFPIRHIFLSPQGLSRARNALLPYADGDIIALTDDDCYYAPESLEHVVDFFANISDACALTGNPNDLLPEYAQWGENRFSIFRNAPSWVIFLRATAVRSTGFFDDSLGIGSDGPYQSGEETDYLLRIWKGNIGSIQRRGNVRIFHDMISITDTNAIMKAYGYALGRMKLLRKHEFPLWFKLSNILYPLACLAQEGLIAWPYRRAMFWGRLKGIFQRGI